MFNRKDQNTSWADVLMSMCDLFLQLMLEGVSWIFFASVVLIPCLAPIVQANDVVVVVLDDSGSMKEQMKTDNGSMSRIEAAKKALEAVVDHLPEDTQLGILLMNGAQATDHWILPLSHLEKGSAKAKIGSIRAHGGTPLGHAMKLGMNELLQVRSKLVYGHYRLLVVTDGEATDGNTLSTVFPDLISRGITVDVIGVDMKTDHSLSKFAHTYRRASDASSFKKAIEEVFAETKSGDGEEDFALLEALPEEFAREALAALANVNNAEVGKNPIPNSPEFGTAVSFQNNSGGGSSFFRFLGTACCFGIFLLLLLFAGIGSVSKRRRR